MTSRLISMDGPNSAQHRMLALLRSLTRLTSSNLLSLSVCLWVSLSLSVFLYVSVCLSLSVSLSMSLSLSLSLSVCLCLSLSVCLSVSVSLVLSVCLHVCLSLSQFLKTQLIWFNMHALPSIYTLELDLLLPTIVVKARDNNYIFQVCIFIHLFIAIWTSQQKTHLHIYLIWPVRYTHLLLKNFSFATALSPQEVRLYQPPNRSFSLDFKFPYVFI